jgi:hypothetical protein
MFKTLKKKIYNIYKPTLKKKRGLYCSPKNSNNRYTCFSYDSLVKIAKSWNKSNKKNRINLKENNTTRKLWQTINNKLKKKYSGEWCWIQEEFVKSLGDREINSTFRPHTPREWYDNKNEWLSTLDIENVMKQYEKVYKNFKFIGPVPIDFDYEYSLGNCIIDELCKIDIIELQKKKINKIGIVFNLDKHDEDGSHWVSMFVNLNKNRVYYFDSYGENPPKEVDVLANRLVEQGLNNNQRIKYIKNDTRFQFKNSECGVYCMYFITQLLKGKTFKSFKKNIIKDDEMMSNRGYFYSPNCSK